MYQIYFFELYCQYTNYNKQLKTHKLQLVQSKFIKGARGRFNGIVLFRLFFVLNFFRFLFRLFRTPLIPSISEIVRRWRRAIPHGRRWWWWMPIHLILAPIKRSSKIIRLGSPNMARAISPTQPSLVGIHFQMIF